MESSTNPPPTHTVKDPGVMDLAHVRGAAISHYKGKVKLNNENDHRELP